MSKKGGFTLMELLVVLAIIAILAGLLMPALGHARRRARVASAESMIASLQTALSMYNLDYGVFPASSSDGTQRNGNSFHADFDGNPNNLAAALTSPDSGGPYMEFKGGDLLENPSPAAGREHAIRDPWGRAYVYMSRKYHDGSSWVNVNLDHGPFYPYTDEPGHNTYNIYSLGPDGMTDGFGAPVTDWSAAGLVTNPDAGHWRAADDSGDPHYDDINSWDGARR